MIALPSPAVPSADDLDLGERPLASLDDVRFVRRVPPGSAGTLTVTDRNLRFRPSGSAMSEVLHGFPSVGGMLSGGERLVVPRSDVRAVATERTLGLFSVLRVTLRDGRVLSFHVGTRDLAPLVTALSASPR